MQAPAPKQTPLWCGPDKGPDKDSSKEAKKNAAAPPGFRGVGEYEVGLFLHANCLTSWKTFKRQKCHLLEHSFMI